MIPSILDLECKSPGEKEIFRRLKEDPATADWIVLHSLDVANHSSQIAGEVDFIVIIPGKGVLFLEVKAHRVIRRTNEGLWYYGSSDNPDIRGPFRQASIAMHSLRGPLLAKRPDLSRILFWSGVIFPFATFKTDSPEWHPWQFIESSRFWSRPLPELILTIVDSARKHVENCPSGKWFYSQSKEPYAEQCANIAELLRPSFEFYINHKLDLSIKDRELLHYTEEQFTALDAMELNNRVIFSGPAGTGKTLLILEEARRSASSGRKVLVLCFNRLLGEWIADNSSQVSEINVRTIHQFMLDVCDKPTIAKEEGTGFWENELPELAIESIFEKENLIGMYDEIIIDEAQDLLRDKYLDVIDLILKGGLSAGRWRMFGDFEKQAIFSASNLSLEEFKTKRVKDIASYQLRVNCRNTPKIAILAQLLGGLKPSYSRVRREDDGIEAIIYYYTNEQEQQQKLLLVLDALYKDGYKGEEIVVLSPKSDGSCSTKITTEPWKSRLKKYRFGLDKGHIRYTTIHAFKGLEAPAVIITDIVDIDNNQDQALMYIGVTRALHRLYILASSKTKTQVLNSMVFNAR